MAHKVVTSADSGKPTGARTPADALGDPSMSKFATDGNQSDDYLCPDCGKVFDTKQGASLHRTNGCYPRLQDSRWLRRQYIDETQSLRDIAEVVGCSRHAVHEALKEKEIDRRSQPEANAHSASQSSEHEKCWDASWLEQKYVVEELSGLKIARIVGCSENAVYRGLKRAGIKRRSYSEAHPGDGDVEYGSGWTVNKKEAVRERDGRACVSCGMGQGEHLKRYGIRHDVHHINGGKSDNQMENLVTLCRFCHLSKWEPIKPLRPDIRD